MTSRFGPSMVKPRNSTSPSTAIRIWVRSAVGRMDTPVTGPLAPTSAAVQSTNIEDIISLLRPVVW